MQRVYWSLLMLVLLCAACQKSTNQSAANQPRREATASENRPAQSGDEKMAIKVTSTAFQDGGMIPKEYTCDGANVSPPLAWEGIPEKAKTLALIVDDPDAPAKTWVHWVVFNLPATTKALPADVAFQEGATGKGVQGTTDFRGTDYGGPCPPNGTHRYFFKLYALDTELSPDSKTTKDELLKAMEGHVIAEGQLMGRYSKQ